MNFNSFHFKNYCVGKPQFLGENHAPAFIYNDYGDVIKRGWRRDKKREKDKKAKEEQWEQNLMQLSGYFSHSILTKIAVHTHSLTHTHPSVNCVCNEGIKIETSGVYRV